VLYVNGNVELANPSLFQELLAREENKVFATALKEAEKKVLSGK